MQEARWGALGLTCEESGSPWTEEVTEPVIAMETFRGCSGAERAFRVSPSEARRPRLGTPALASPWIWEVPKAKASFQRKPPHAQGWENSYWLCTEPLEASSQNPLRAASAGPGTSTQGEPALQRSQGGRGGPEGEEPCVQWNFPYRTFPLNSNVC